MADLQERDRREHGIFQQEPRTYGVIWQLHRTEQTLLCNTMIINIGNVGTI